MAIDVASDERESFRRAQQLFRSGQLPEAIEILEGLHRADPGERDVAVSLGICYYRSNRYSEAEALLRRAASAPGASETAVYYHVLSLRDGGRRADALDAVRRAIANGHGSARVTALETELSRPQDAATPRRTLAEELDAADRMGGGASTEGIRGDLLFERRRTIRSYGARLLLGAAAFLLVWQAGSPRLPGFVRAGLRDAGLGAEALSGIRFVWRLALGVILLVGFVAIATAVLGWVTTRYRFYQRRIDVIEGVLFRRHRRLWLYDVTEVDYEQTPLLVLANTAKIVLKYDQATPSVRDRGRLQVVGAGSARAMSELAEKIQNAVLRERRSMKKQFL